MVDLVLPIYEPKLSKPIEAQFVDDGLSEDMMGSQFLGEFRKQIVGRLGDVGAYEDLMY